MHTVVYIQAFCIHATAQAWVLTHKNQIGSAIDFMHRLPFQHLLLSAL